MACEHSTFGQSDSVRQRYAFGELADQSLYRVEDARFAEAQRLPLRFATPLTKLALRIADIGQPVAVQSRATSALAQKQGNFR